ncbi:MAG: phosphotransferase [Lachnospiraceae bacterium]|nr:phosphotransferase [Lachnospiraceae bacterium]
MIKTLLAENDLIPFCREEDGTAYSVWKVTVDGKLFVLKLAKGCEAEIYRTFFTGAVKNGLNLPVPELYDSAVVDNKEYLLMEYVEGRNLCHCGRDALKRVLDALISLQKRFWDMPEYQDATYSFEKALEQRKKRGEYLNDPVLEAAYDVFVESFCTIPRTLCHDDLLPFNVLVSDHRAVLIDWEAAGILPYPTSLARLIAHGSEIEGAFFWMTEADKAFAVQYFYEHLVRDMGISYDEYRRTLDYFLLYEYCEWIMLGNRYEDADMERYAAYREKAHGLLREMGRHAESMTE